MKKKAASVVLAIVMLVGTVPAYAADVTTAGGKAESQVTLNVGGTTPQIFSATIPSEIPISINKDGVVTVASNLKISNASSAAIEVTAIEVAGKGGWDIKDYTYDMDSEASGTKYLALQFRGDSTDQSGAIGLSAGNWEIAKDSDLMLNAEAKLPSQTESSDNDIATVTWTLDWANSNVTPPTPPEPTDPVIPPEPSEPVNPPVPTDPVDPPEPSEPVEPTEVALSADNRDLVGYTGAVGEELVIPELFTGADGQSYKVTSISSSAFEGCTGLKSVQLPSSIKTVGASAFSGCSSLETLVLNEGLESLGNSVFEGCAKLQQVVFPSTLQSVGSYAFMDCSELSSVTLNDGLTQLGSSAFSRSVLQAVHIPKTLTSIGSYAFRTETLAEITVDSENTAFTVEDNVLFNKDMTKLIQCPAKGKSGSYTIPDTVTSISDWAFAYTSDLTGVTVPTQVTKLAMSVFRQSGLTSVAIPAGIQSIGTSAFQGCQSLATVTFEGPVKLGMRAFSDCTSLGNLQFNGGKLTGLDQESFGNCTSLTSLTLDFNSVKDNFHQSALEGCTGLKTITITNSPVNTVLPNSPWGAVNAKVTYTR